MAQIYTYSGVIVHFNPDCTDEFVTHADYKALEDKYATLLKSLGDPVTDAELKRAWNMIGQRHPEKEWVKRALLSFIKLRLFDYAVEEIIHSDEHIEAGED